MSGDRPPERVRADAGAAPLPNDLRPFRSKTLATWIAFVGGGFGLHRFYLHGFGDRWGWAFVPPTLAGLVGVLRMRELGADDRLAWLLIPFAGFSIAIAMFSAILYGLTPDERWNARFDPLDRSRSGWPAVLGVIAALIVGGIVLMATIAFSAQRYFEYDALRRTEASG